MPSSEDYEDCSSETDDSYDEDYDSEEIEEDGAWDDFFVKFRKESMKEQKNFEKKEPLLADSEDKEISKPVIKIPESEDLKKEEKKEDSPTEKIKEDKEEEKVVEGDKDIIKEEEKEEREETEEEEKSLEEEKSNPVVEEDDEEEEHSESIVKQQIEEKEKVEEIVEKDSNIPNTPVTPTTSDEGKSSKKKKKSGEKKETKSKSNREAKKEKSEKSEKSESDSEASSKKMRRTKRTTYKNTGEKLLETPEEIIPSSKELGRETLTPSSVEEKRKSYSSTSGSLLQRLKLKKEKGGSKQDQRRSATKIQALWRGYHFRKQLNSTGIPLSVSLKQLISLRQIVELETQYVSQLHIIITNYLSPLMEFNKLSEEARKALPVQVVKAIFRNIETIYNFHVGFLNDLEKRVEKWPFVSDIPALFIKATASLSIYSRYAEDAAAAEETLRFYKEKPPLSTFLTKMYNERLSNADDPNQKILGLYALLVMPYKHLGKLHQGFSSFMCNTPSSYPDYQLLADAVAIISQLKRFIWETAEVAISKRKMTILQKKIQSANSNTTSTVAQPRVITLNPNQPINAENLNAVTQKTKKTRKKSRRKDSNNSSSKKKKKRKTSKDEQLTDTIQSTTSTPFKFELYEPNRKLIRNGPLLVDSQKRQVFLFNDVCLVLEVIAAHNSRFEGVFELQSAEIHSKQVSLSENQQTFRIRSPAGDFAFTESLNPEDDEVLWLQTFDEWITLANDKIFGATLANVVKREKSAIPSVVLSIVQYLNDNIAEPDLFQPSFNSNSVQRLRDPSAHRKLNNSKVADVVGLLILYLEQLPDILIGFDPKDPIFTAQSTPDESTLLEWVRKQLDTMPVCNRNLLEYLMSFFSKVLARSASNNVTSIDLAVIFSPLLFRPETLTLAYCYRMARVVRLVRIMIERAGDLFRTVDDDSLPLPQSLEEFFTADQFGQWWRDFRQKKQYFIKYIACDNIVKELVNFILNIPSCEESPEQKKQAQFASLAYGMLVNDGVISAMFSSWNLLSLIIDEFKGQKISERANKHFCDFIEVLLRGNPGAMLKYLDENPSRNLKIVESIGSGNFCNMILSVAETWQQSEIIHKIITSWGVAALDQYLISKESFDSDQLANTVRFLRFLVRTNTFMNSSLSKPFTSKVCNPEFSDKMIEKAISSDSDTCVCTIPLVIEILVQNKNRTPGKSPLDQIVLNPPNSKNMSEEEKNEFIEKQKEARRLLKEQLKEDVPSVILSLLNRHEKIVELMRLPLKNDNEKEKIPLGFFRFGLVKLIQALLVTNYPYGNSFIAQTDLVAASLELFFHYYQHSILHSVIAYIVRYIMAMGNRELVEMLIIKLNLPGQIVNVFNSSENSDKVEFLSGYVKMLSIAIRNSAIGEAYLKNNSEWDNYVKNILLREETNQSETSTQKQVALAQKKIARSNLTKTEFTDSIEDKIG